MAQQGTKKVNQTLSYQGMQPKQGTRKIKKKHYLHSKGMAQQGTGNVKQTLSYPRNAAQARYKERSLNVDTWF